MSPRYQLANPTLVATLRENSRVRAQLHNLFETIVDLTGVDYQDRVASLSLFSHEYQEPRSLEFLSISEHPVSLPLEFGDSERPSERGGDAKTTSASAVR